jgi:hypothetical protein
VFEASRAWKYTEDPDGPKKEAATTKKEAAFDRKAVMGELTAAGVEFKGNASNEDLAQLLAEAKKRAAPAAAPAPGKEPAGVGDQDVI